MQLLQIIEDLTRGDSYRGISKLTDPTAQEAISSAFRLFSPISAAVDRIAAGSASEPAGNGCERLSCPRTELEQRDLYPVPALDRVGDASGAGGGVLAAMLRLVCLVAVAATVMLYRSQGGGSRPSARGASAINDALRKIADGDFTVQVTEQDGPISGEIARQLNAAINRQRGVG